MDNVLVDFNQGVVGIGHGHALADDAPEDDKTRMYQAIEKHGPQWWSGLPWAPRGTELWNFLVQNSPEQPPVILSSPGTGGSFIHKATTGKKTWLKENLPGVTYHLDSNKSQWANNDPMNVLIDDMSKNITAWKLAGGTGILHTSTPETIHQVKELLAGKRQKESLASLIRKTALNLGN